MIIRGLVNADFEQIKSIHEKYYKEEFCIDEFFDRIIHCFTVVDNSTIISVMGIKPIIEAVAITNKDVSVRKRREALYKLLQANMFSTQSIGYSQLHAFIQEPEWYKHLGKAGFRKTKGNSLVLNVS